MYTNCASNERLAFRGQAVENEVTLGDLAAFVTSKNAGPFLVTVDIVFATRAAYEHVRDRGVVTRALISRLYGCPADDVVTVVHFEPAKAIKATFRRPVSSGGPGDTDVYGAQQHVPLMRYRVPAAVPETHA